MYIKEDLNFHSKTIHGVKNNIQDKNMKENLNKNYSTPKA